MSTPAPAAAPTPTPASTPAATPSPDSGFLQGTPPASATPAGEKPSTFFGQHIAGPDGKFQEGWTESLRTSGFERLATKAAMAPDEATFFRSLDETLAFVGKKSAPTYPGPDASDAELSAFRSSAGIPDSAEAYNLKPEAIPDGVQWNEEQAADLAKLFHQHHIPEKTAQALIAKHLESQTSLHTHHAAAQAQRLSALSTESDATFRKEWGDQFESRLEANRSFISTRLPEADLKDPALAVALSHPQIVRIIDEARRALREAPLPGVDAAVQGGSLSPQQQAFEIMKANPNWEKDPGTAKRVYDLYNLDAAQKRRSARK